MLPWLLLKLNHQHDPFRILCDPVYFFFRIINLAKLSQDMFDLVRVESDTGLLTQNLPVLEFHFFFNLKYNVASRWCIIDTARITTFHCFLIRETKYALKSFKMNSSFCYLCSSFIFPPCCVFSTSFIVLYTFSCLHCKMGLDVNLIVYCL